VKKSNCIPKAMIVVIACSIISTILVDYIEKRDLLTSKGNLTSHLEEFKSNDQNKVSVVLKRKIGDQYVLLYSLNGKKDKVGLAYYIKTDLFPLYEMVRDEEARHPSMGSSFLNNKQFIVFGNVTDSEADYFQYRDYIDFKKVPLGTGPYFLHVASYDGQLSVPLVEFYNSEGEVVATAPAK
jgi:hypothetical protein